MRITVFGSSSTKTPSKFLEVAFTLGALLAKQGHTCVNGGGRFGCMGSLNEGVRSESGNILGVIHEKFCVDNGEDVLITHMIYTGGSDLTARKQGLLDNGDGILVLPGGVGKFDELWDAVCGKSLDMKGMKHKPICVINSDGYFDGSIMQLKRAFEEGLLYHAVEDYFHVESTPSLALTWLMSKLEDRTISGTDDATSNVDKRMSIRSNA